MSSQFSGPWLPWFHGDFIRATQGWTLLERGAYFMLLGASWEMGPLPKDPRRLAGIIGAQLDELEEAWKVVGPKFEVTDEGYINRRLELHRDKQEARSEKARQSALGRWSGRIESESDANVDADAHANGDANASESQTKSDANSMLLRSQILDLRSQSSEPKQPRARARAATATPPFHQQVIDAYHELCTDLPRVKDWTPKRRQALAERIRERCNDGKPADSIAYWREVFEKVAASDFLCGRKTDFRAPGLAWLLGPENFLKTIEGNYDNHKANGDRAHG